MKNKADFPIGIFDSGVGGLTVVLEVLRQMPGESFLYYADTAHVPYGPRDPKELKGFAMSISEFLIKQNCKMIIIACNTSTSLAYNTLKQCFDVPIIGVIEPGVDKALEATVNERVGIIATEATINSNAYQNMLIAKNNNVNVYTAACPHFVPMIERGELEGDNVYNAALSYLQPMIDEGIDSLILGCTHYPFLLPVITKILGPSVTTINPARETVSRAKENLKELGLLKQEGKPFCKYYASGNPDQFKKVADVFLNRDIGKVFEPDLRRDK